jgi:hypothetical protein
MLYEDGSPIRVEEEHEASLVLRSSSSDPAMLALIQMHRGHWRCVECTLERSIETEIVVIEHFLTRHNPPIAVESAERRLKLLKKYRAAYPFREAQCPPEPCYEGPETAAQQADEPDVE